MNLNDINFFVEAKKKKNVLNSNPVTFSVLEHNTVQRLKLKYRSEVQVLKLFDMLLKELEQNGRITSHNVHPLKHEKIRSQHSKKDELGWVIVWLSRTNELRLAYKKFKDGNIEVKFGTPKDIGYKH